VARMAVRAPDLGERGLAGVMHAVITASLDAAGRGDGAGGS
jgi:hypothetical protein